MRGKNAMLAVYFVADLALLVCLLLAGGCSCAGCSLCLCLDDPFCVTTDTHACICSNVCTDHPYTSAVTASCCSVFVEPAKDSAALNAIRCLPAAQCGLRSISLLRDSRKH